MDRDDEIAELTERLRVHDDGSISFDGVVALEVVGWAFVDWIYAYEKNQTGRWAKLSGEECDRLAKHQWATFLNIIGAWKEATDERRSVEGLQGS